MTYRDYQVAVSNDPQTPARKWTCLGTFTAPSHKSAAYDAHQHKGTVVAEHPNAHGVVFEFPESVFVRVGF